MQDGGSSKCVENRPQTWFIQTLVYLSLPASLSPSFLSFPQCLVFFFFFWPCYAVLGILIHWPGIEPEPLAVKVQSPKHWDCQGIPNKSFSMTSLESISALPSPTFHFVVMNEGLESWEWWTNFSGLCVICTLWSEHLGKKLDTHSHHWACARYPPRSSFSHAISYLFFFFDFIRMKLIR